MHVFDRAVRFFPHGLAEISPLLKIGRHVARAFFVALMSPLSANASKPFSWNFNRFPLGVSRARDNVAHRFFILSKVSAVCLPRSEERHHNCGASNFT